MRIIPVFSHICLNIDSNIRSNNYLFNLAEVVKLMYNYKIQSIMVILLIVVLFPSTLRGSNQSIDLSGPKCFDWLWNWSNFLFN
jgi:hypothetical protein